HNHSESVAHQQKPPPHLVSWQLYTNWHIRATRAAPTSYGTALRAYARESQWTLVWGEMDLVDTDTGDSRRPKYRYWHQVSGSTGGFGSPDTARCDTMNIDNTATAPSVFRF